MELAVYVQRHLLALKETINTKHSCVKLPVSMYSSL